jgi:glutathionyl-hydroquinone reductase
MGLMVDGVWRDVPRDTKSTGGQFIRPDTEIDAVNERV